MSYLLAAAFIVQSVILIVLAAMGLVAWLVPVVTILAGGILPPSFFFLAILWRLR